MNRWCVKNYISLGLARNKTLTLYCVAIKRKHLLSFFYMLTHRLSFSATRSLRALSGVVNQQQCKLTIGNCSLCCTLSGNVIFCIHFTKRIHCYFSLSPTALILLVLHWHFKNRNVKQKTLVGKIQTTQRKWSAEVKLSK